MEIRKYDRPMQPHEMLEAEWATFNELDPEGMVACSSGTAALHLAFEAMRLPPGSSVLVPDFTMVACPRAVVLAGLTPVFVDCRAEDLNMDPGLVREAISDNTSAIMLVHVYGRKASLGEPIGWPQPSPDARIVEDLAEAHGVRPHGETDAACWSFQSSKIIHGEEGGAVWFRDPAHARIARSLRTMGFTDAWDFSHIPRGHNYRMSNLHAEPIRNSLIHYWDNYRRRRILEEGYDRICPHEWRMPPRRAPWIYDLRIPGVTTDRQNRVVKSLRDAGIAARHAFKPMSSQVEFKDCRRVGGDNATRMSQEVIYLPLHPDRTSEDVPALAFRLIQDAL